MLSISSTITSRAAIISQRARGVAGQCHQQASATATAKRYLSSSSTSTSTTATTTKATIVRKTKVSPSDRAALRQARKQRAATAQQQSASKSNTGPGATSSSSSSSSNASSSTASSSSTSAPMDPRLVFGLGITIPTALIAWGVYDETSPPAKIASYLGMDDFAESFAKPNEEKLLPNWHDMKDVPKDFQPMTLVLDLEETLVNATWDRKHGWRIAKRPGVIQFIRELAQYYEIVIYTPSTLGVAIPIIEALQMETGGGIMHMIFREGCYYKNGIYMKDLSRLNRNPARVILIDDDEKAAMLNPENLVKVKPYIDANDRKDDTLERLIPFLIEIATENYSDARVVLKQFEGMDANDIANELEHRVKKVQNVRSGGRGLGAWSNAGKMAMPTPEMAPVDRSKRKAGTGGSGAGGGITAKDLVGGNANAPPGSSTKEKGLTGWLQKRQEAQAKEKMEKMEHWNRLMMERSEQKKQQSS